MIYLFFYESEIWSQLEERKVHKFYASPNIKRVTKSRRMRWTGNIAPDGKAERKRLF
jgi:hypothetical protein